MEQYIAHITSVKHYENNYQAMTKDQSRQPLDLHDVSTSDPDTSFPSRTDTQSSYSSQDETDSTHTQLFFSTSTSDLWHVTKTKCTHQPQ